MSSPHYFPSVRQIRGAYVSAHEYLFHHNLIALRLLHRLYVRLQRARIFPFGLKLGLQFFHQALKALNFNFHPGSVMAIRRFGGRGHRGNG